MPARTPRMDQRTPPEEGSSYPSDVFASNLRAYRRLRDLEQEMVANRLANFGHTWTRQTVSDVERGRRNVTVDELLALTDVLGANVSELLDPRGPGGRKGPRLYLGERVTSVAPDDVAGLVCSHRVAVEVEWRDVQFLKATFTDVGPEEVEQG